MYVKIKLLNQDAKVPYRGSTEAAGFDLYSTKGLYVMPGLMRSVPTGIALEIPQGYFGAIFPRSGLASKEGLRLANCVGVIDSDYRGEIMVLLYNDSRSTRHVTCGERIAQIIFLPYASVDFEQVDELSDTKRDAGGFGSSGKE